VRTRWFFPQFTLITRTSLRHWNSEYYTARDSVTRNHLSKFELHFECYTEKVRNISKSPPFGPQDRLCKRSCLLITNFRVICNFVDFVVWISCGNFSNGVFRPTWLSGKEAFMVPKTATHVNRLFVVTPFPVRLLRLSKFLFYARATAPVAIFTIH